MNNSKEDKNISESIPESIKESFTGIIQVIPVMEHNPKGTRYFFGFFCVGGIIYCISLWIQKPSVSELKAPVKNINGKIIKIDPTEQGNGFDIDTYRMAP